MSRAVTDDSILETWGAGGEFPLSLRGLDVAQGVEGGDMGPGGVVMGAGLPHHPVHVVTQGQVVGLMSRGGASEHQLTTP